MFGKMAFIPSKGYFHSFEEANVDTESFGKFLIPQSPSSLLQDNQSAQSTQYNISFVCHPRHNNNKNFPALFN